VIEALKSGMIILVSKGVGSYPEYANGNGFSFEVNSVDSIIEAIEKILSLELPYLIKMSSISYQLGQSITAKNSAFAFNQAIKHALQS
jgi:glycosyltransferase involved in cell wall biosynthesis